MTTIVTRAGKGSALTFNEVDGNFTNLNTDKIEKVTSSVDNELVLWSGTTGAVIKSATLTGIVKATSGVASAATAGTDYLAPPSGTAILKANSGGALANASAGTDYVSPTGSETLSNKTLTSPVISTIVNTGTITLPTSTDTLVARATTDTLTNKTLGSGTVLGANVSGQDFNLTRVDLQDFGYVYFNSGTTNALDYVNGSHQRWAPNTGAQTLSITNWPPSGNLGELLIEGVNLGAATITWPTINWIKSDGTTTTTFSANGVTLQASGIDWVLLWTRDAGTTIYGKVVR
jgi:hypothetical protein